MSELHLIYNLGGNRFERLFDLNIIVEMVIMAEIRVFSFLFVSLFKFVKV